MSRSLHDYLGQEAMVGARVERLLEERQLTKVGLCTATDISRPTLDKFLAGEITNHANFLKYLDKILKALRLNPDTFLPERNRSRIRNYRTCLGKSLADLAEGTGLSEERLLTLEAGEEGSLAELRDIALFLGTSVAQLLGQTPTFPLDSRPWGQVSILLPGRKERLCFPIAQNEAEWIPTHMGDPVLVIPTLDGRILYLQTASLRELLLQPGGVEQVGEEKAGQVSSPSSSKASEAPVPLAYLEALPDYLASGNSQDCPRGMSPRFFEGLRVLAVKDHRENLRQEQVLAIYLDGESLQLGVDFSQGENLSFLLQTLYLEGSLPKESFLTWKDDSGNTTYVNLRHLAFLEAPYLSVEAALWKSSQTCT
ncbi:MAG: helix-turn-helix domain-containing protein [Selenomonadaceae bacterium]|nr:helix-turn-helix domain-containing protein [Selenomonadaceae bacterium]